MSIPWFCCSLAEDGVHLSVNRPDNDHWDASFSWKQITKVCFKATDIYSVDVIRIYLDDGTHYDIPLEAEGGYNLWEQLIDRGLFDSELAAQLRFAENEIRCWPP
ncbi:MAG: hypothetical protein D6732_23930 [Methanobacteriota archaeon]|nr:MAG: hypothetical protein D6732_23930 [Euryarchaeota archaeon]